RLDRIEALVDRRRARGAGVLDPRRRLEAEPGVGLEDQRGRKLLAHETRIHGADEDLVDLRGLEPRVMDRLARDLRDQRLDILVLVLAELAVGPADDAGGHGASRSQGEFALDIGCFSFRQKHPSPQAEPEALAEKTLTLRRPDDWHAHFRDG